MELCTIQCHANPATEEELPGACRELMANAHNLGFFSLTNLSDLAALVSTPPF